MEIIQYEDTRYPTQLRKIKKMPEQLYVEGNIELLHNDGIAVVGSRVNTPWGEQITKEFVKAFVQNGLVVISGMAKGIDSIAHKTCIQQGGRTIAILGCGIEYAKTMQDTALCAEILASGSTILSEYEPNEPAKSFHFPARNRIISGMSRGVFVVEAAFRSGTSITAKLAMEQGKKVYCLPQEREARKGVGTNHLLQIGATLITKPEEIIQDLGVLKHTVPCKKGKGAISEEEKAIYAQLQKGNRTPTQLSIALKQPIFKIQSMLMKMELEEKIRKDSLGRIIKI